MLKEVMGVTGSGFKLPIFLTPAYSQVRLIASTTSWHRSFSSSARHGKVEQSHNSKRKKDANKERGVSALRSTGPRHKTRAYKYPLPEPAKDVDPTSVPYEMNQEHGLYQFFNKDRDTMIPPNEEDAHGRGWTEKELSKKDFYDLWRLHWTCVKEQNRVATRNNERARLKVGYGKVEISERLAAVRETMANIRKVLIKRHENYSNGAILLENYSLVELFPDAVHTLPQLESEPEVFINEISGDEHNEFELEPPLQPSVHDRGQQQAEKAQR